MKYNLTHHVNRRTLLLALFVFSALAAAHAQHFDWVKSIDGYETGSSLGNIVRASTTDSNGNLYICGNYGWGADLGSVPLPGSYGD